MLDLTEDWNLDREPVLWNIGKLCRGSSVGGGSFGEDVILAADMDLGRSAKESFLTVVEGGTLSAGVERDLREVFFFRNPGIAGRSISGEEGETGFIPS